ncbi:MULTISPECIES: ACT domain-containing protein [Vibrio]|uniref:ACT domain-containing protein n=1 Tax=Vibrio TaxID=662 RepID=UPI001F5D21D3|nr:MULTISPECIES: ACT domain-containing protein [Vibrio]MCR9807895.1 hypothetical protein [Vibrio parahaemolyticus]
MASKFVFCTVSGALRDYLTLNPVLNFVETEGLTLDLDILNAISVGISFECLFKQITLTVHSSVEAIG